MRLYQISSFLFILILISFLTACSHTASPYHLPSEQIDDPSLETFSFQTGVPEKSRYILKNFDELSIKFFYHQDLNEEVIIRPDGYITLQLIGDVQAAGKKTEELRQELKGKFSDLLKEAEIAVIVKKFTAPKAYVGGLVNNPGVVMLDTEITVMQAIIQSGGFRFGAKNTDIIILRNNGTKQPSFYKMNLKEHMAHRAAEDFFLQASDIVFVPQTQVNSTAQFFAENIGNIVPIYRNMSINYDFIHPK